MFKCGVFLVLATTLCACNEPQRRHDVPNLPVQSTPASASGSEAASPGGLGAGEIRATPVTPGQCSDTFLVEGNVLQLPSSRRHIWVVRKLEADPGNGAPDAQHYAKMQIDYRKGIFSLTVPNSTPTGTKKGPFLLVVADDAASVELQRSYDADVRHDTNAYPDGRRVTLPPGSDAIARTTVLEEKCP